MGVGKELEPVAPCECAKDHLGRWLKRHPRHKYEVVDLNERCFPEDYEAYMNEFFFPLPETHCECAYCEIFKSKGR